ncbi:Murein hydrolase activator NlpD [termite gut metagenome]|uniref:Murein hydrolase activator NlpD n=1 Tax=termite gut metagenome TaxID=433724 RepID=A0A5J4QR32_9ZZZZ
MKSVSLKTIGTLIVISIIFSTDIFSQDLIAKQAPVDKTLKRIDSLALRNLMKVDINTYASDLYPDWNNKYVHPSRNEWNVPDSYSIDLTGFCMPVNYKTHITSSFGIRRKRMHKGIDLKIYIGDTIVAAFDGKVRIVNTERRGYGKYVVMRHNNGLETIYGHLSAQLVKENQEVKAGEPIGLGGNTGRSTGSHLHFETRFLGVAINPAELFDFQKQDIVADTYIFTKQKASEAATLMAITNRNAGNNEVIRYYKVKVGDTLSQIATTNGISVPQLCKLNRISVKTTLNPGQVLRCS